jgi:hypothetical protein
MTGGDGNGNGAKSAAFDMARPIKSAILVFGGGGTASC